MTMLIFQQLNIQMCHLGRKLQETDDPITKLVAVLDTVLSCFATFKWLTTYVL